MVYIDIQFSYNFALFISIFKLQNSFSKTKIIKPKQSERAKIA